MLILTPLQFRPPLVDVHHIRGTVTMVLINKGRLQTTMLYIHDHRHGASIKFSLD